MTPLKANTIISSILLLILLMLPYEAMAQRRRVRELKGPVVYSPPKNDSLRVDTLKNDTLKANVLKADTLSAESVKKKKQPRTLPLYILPMTLLSLHKEDLPICMEMAR